MTTDDSTPPAASQSNRRALVHNAITNALSDAGDWVPLSVRIAATRAALAEVDAWHEAERPAVPSAVVAPPTDQTTPSHRAGLREQIAGALIAWTYRGKEPDPETGILETVRANAYSRADAVLVVLYREWPWLRAEAEDAAPTTTQVVPREHVAEAVLAAVEAALGDTLLPDARREALAGIVAALPEPADEVDADTVANRAAQVITTMGAEIRELKHSRGRYRTAWLSARHRAGRRRMADETATTQTQPRRGDRFEQWLKTQRDKHRDDNRGRWSAYDDLLDLYRLHADTGTPLGSHVCEAKVVGDCECLEQPAAGARQDDETASTRCTECGHPKSMHGEGEDPVTPGRCTACPDDDAWHDYQPATTARQDGSQP